MLFFLHNRALTKTHPCWRSPISICLLLGALLVAGCGGGGGGSESVQISGAILMPGGEATDDNPIGLQGVADRSVSLYKIDNEGNILGDVLDSTTSDEDGNYVLLLPADTEYTSNIIVEADLGNDQVARAIVLDATTDITPITEYITQKLIEDPDLDLENLPVEEVNDLIAFVESLPLAPQPDLSSMLQEIEDFSEEAIEAQINDLSTDNPQIRLSGLLSVPGGAAPRGNGLALRPIPNTIVELFLIDDNGNPVGEPIATAMTNDEGVFTLLLPVDQELSAELMLRAIVDGETVRALVTSEVVNIDPTSEYLFGQILQIPNVDVSVLPVTQLNDIVGYVNSLNIEETDDLSSTLDEIDAVAGSEVNNLIGDVIALINANGAVWDEFFWNDDSTWQL